MPQQNLPGRDHGHESFVVDLSSCVHVSGFPQDRARTHLVVGAQTTIQHRTDIETNGRNVLEYVLLFSTDDVYDAFKQETPSMIGKGLHTPKLTTVAAAIKNAGVVLSHPVKRTTPSRG